MRTLTVTATSAVISVLTLTAAGRPRPLGDPPRGAGTEIGITHPDDDVRVYQGTQIAGFLGVGYGTGVGGRLGYAFSSGMYLGGAYTFYTGNASFLGGELGYKFFPAHRWELEPYVFVGPAFIRVGDTGFGRPGATTILALQPGILTAYHFGPAFISAELRGYIEPNPGALAFFGGFGAAL
jgi:hypothetical protein